MCEWIQIFNEIFKHVKIVHKNAHENNEKNDKYPNDKIYIYTDMLNQRNKKL